MFSVIRAYQLKALNFQLLTYASEEQNVAERPVSVCPSVCRNFFFPSHFKYDTGTNFVFCVYSQKARAFDSIVLKYMYIKLDNTNCRHVELSSQLIYISLLTVYLRAKK